MRRTHGWLLLAALWLLAPASAHAADPGRWVQTGEHTAPLYYYQGITHDPDANFYFDGIHVGLYKTDSELSELARKDDVIPPEVHAAEGYDHIGDLTWEPGEGGRLLLPLECYYPVPGAPSNTCPPNDLQVQDFAPGSGAIGVADDDTLEWQYYVKLDGADTKKAMWVELSPDGELLWTQGGAGSEDGGPGNDLLAYRVSDINRSNAAPAAAPIKAVRRVAGAVPPSGITGAAFYGGRMFVAGQQDQSDSSADLFQVWSIDLDTGERRLEIEREITGESEGITAVRALDGRLHWLIQPYNTEAPPSYGVTNATILSFSPTGSPSPDTSPGPGTEPDPVAGVLGEKTGRSCLPAHSRVSARGVGRIRLGASRRMLESIAGTASSRGRTLGWCVEGGGELRVLLSRDGRALLIVTTARRHEAAGAVGPGDPASALREPIRVARNLVAGDRARRILFGLRGRRVAYVAVAGRRLAADTRALRAALRAAR